MNIENQVVSLELAEELKNSGYVQEGIWWWTCHQGVNDKFTLTMLENSHESKGLWKTIVAPTVAELGEELPAGIYNSEYDAEFAIYKNGDKTGYRWFVVYTDCITGENRLFEENNILADAMCKMWLYLKKI